VVFIGLDAEIHSFLAEDSLEPQRVLEALGDVNEHRVLVFEEGSFLFHRELLTV
jgi:hypothetical protein